MSILKNFAAAAVASGVMASVTPASAIIVGGIDFGAAGGISHIETTTLAASFVNGVGQVATQYGLVTNVNGDATYCADGTANCSLYFVSTNTVSAAAGTTLYLNGTSVTIFYSPVAATNLLGQDSIANLAFINALSKWATLKGENGVDATANGLASDTQVTQTIIGPNLSITGGGLLSINTADGFGLAGVEAFLDSNGIPTFTATNADVQFTESGSNLVLNAFDLAGPLADSCRTAAPQVGDWCIAGTLDLRGLTAVPAPASLALLGLGLFGFGMMRRFLKN